MKPKPRVITDSTLENLMKWSMLTTLAFCVVAGGCRTLPAAGASQEEGWISLFNGRDLSGWNVPEGDNGHWKVVDGVIDYDALSEADGDRNLWTAESYGDFVLRVDWRIKEPAGMHVMRNILPDGSYELDEDGEEIRFHMPNADSGILLRGSSKAQLNIWMWPVGSGEMWGYRTDESMPPEVRAGVTPSLRADYPVGDWNTFEITMRGDRTTVVLNGRTVLKDAHLPDVPGEGPIGLQHHGGIRDGRLLPTSSLIQFRNIEIRKL